MSRAHLTAFVRQTWVVEYWRPGRESRDDDDRADARWHYIFCDNEADVEHTIDDLAWTAAECQIRTEEFGACGQYDNRPPSRCRAWSADGRQRRFNLPTRIMKCVPEVRIRQETEREAERQKRLKDLKRERDSIERQLFAVEKESR